MAKILVITGIILIVLGLLWPLFKNLGIGQLPGDIIFKRGGFTFYFPIVTCIILSILLSIILWFFNRHF